MSRPVIITCAVTGSSDTSGKNPNVPILPEDIARNIVDAALEGAAIAHVHVRDPATGKEARDAALFREVVTRVRESKVDVILNLTSAVGTAVFFDEENPSRLAPSTDFLHPRERFIHIAENQPEICSLDMCTMMYGPDPYINLPEHIRHIAEAARRHGVKPEIEIFNPGDIVLMKEMAQDLLFDEPLLVQIVLGVRYGAPATAMALLAMLQDLPARSIWTAFATGAQSLSMAAQSVLLGGHVRIGLEDNLWLEKGVLASNAALTAQAVAMINALGHRPATVAEARSILGLRVNSTDTATQSVAEVGGVRDGAGTRSQPRQ